MVGLGQDLLVGSRWAQIAGRLCRVVAGGGDILIVATRLARAATGIGQACESQLSATKSSFVNIMIMAARQRVGKNRNRN